MDAPAKDVKADKIDDYPVLLMVVQYCIFWNCWHNVTAEMTSVINVLHFSFR
jgi:hypothetical protein